MVSAVPAVVPVRCGPDKITSSGPQLVPPHSPTHGGRDDARHDHRMLSAASSARRSALTCRPLWALAALLLLVRFDDQGERGRAPPSRSDVLLVLVTSHDVQALRSLARPVDFAERTNVSAVMQFPRISMISVTQFPTWAEAVTGRPTDQCAAGPVGKGRLWRRYALASRPPWTALTSLNDGLVIGRQGNLWRPGDPDARSSSPWTRRSRRHRPPGPLRDVPGGELAGCRQRDHPRGQAIWGKGGLPSVSSDSFLTSRRHSAVRSRVWQQVSTEVVE